MDGPLLSSITVQPDSRAAVITAKLAPLKEKCDLYVTFDGTGLRLITVTFGVN